jgi:hypothetical protein
MTPLEQFIQQRGIKFTAHEVTLRPDGLMGDSFYHFKCRIAQGKRGFTLYFSQGSGLPNPPTAKDVLSCLADDAHSYENASGDFERWAKEFGYDTDSRKAEKIYRITKRQSEQLRRTLGEDNYSYLLWDVMNAEHAA